MARHRSSALLDESAGLKRFTIDPDQPNPGDVLLDFLKWALAGGLVLFLLIGVLGAAINA